MQVLDFTKLKGTEYLKAVRWFEYRTGTCFFIEDNKLKKSKSNTLLDENYQMFGEFLKTYKGALPEIKSQKAEIEEDYIEKSLYTTNFTEPLSYQDSAFLKLPKFP